MSAPLGAGRRHGGETAPGGRTSSGAPSDPYLGVVGREVELGEIRRLAAGHRLLTLTGPGGMGKTTLARAIAQDPPSGTDRATFVRLSRIRDASLIPGAIMDAMSLRGADGTRPVDLIVGHVGGGRDLLILDNLEHLPEAAETILELLDRCEELRILATSRSPLRITSEWVFEVPALQTPSTAADPASAAAVVLFIERARATGGLADPTSEDLDVIADICERLEGLPLAIELAASRARHLPLGSIRTYLDDALALLEGGGVDKPERHRALDRTIAWSYDLLDAPVAAIFGRLGVFVGSFEPRAVRAVVGDVSSASEIQIINSLSRLVDQSLVRQAPPLDGSPRYSLHEVIRQFALTVVDDEDVARRRHLSHYAGLAEEAERGLVGIDQADWIQRIGRELPNLRAALGRSVVTGDHESLFRLAAALGDYWRRNGDPREGLEWLERALSTTEDVELRLRARALYGSARLLFDEGEREQALVRLEESMVLADAAGDLEMGVRSRAGLGIVRVLTGHADEAEVPVSEADVLAHRSGDPGLLAEVLEAESYIRGSVELDASTHLWEQVIELERQTGNQRSLAGALLNLANLRLLDGDHSTSARLIEDAVHILAGFETDNNLPYARLMLGFVRIRLGRLNDAREPLEQGARSVVRGPVAHDHIFAAEAIGEWLGTAGSHEEALRAWAAADRAREERAILADVVDEAWLARGVTRDRSSVPEGIAAERWREGREMLISEAIELGLAAMRATGVRRPTASDGPAPETLTKREREVLALLVEGKADGDIATALFISPKTASVHVANIKGKLGASSRVDIVTTAIRLGLVESPSTP